MKTLKTPVIALVGPTASGKTDVAQQVALALDGAVISADSMQLYRGMDIGTGKLPVRERLVPHYGFDLRNPGEPYSAALFQEYGRTCIEKLDDQGTPSVLCGGTGLYVRAVIDDYQFPTGDQVANPVRDRYTAYAATHGNEALWRLLQERDPESAAVVHPNNVRRVVRAFELLEEGGSYARQKEQLSHIPSYLPSVQFGLAVDPAILNERINRRVDAMMEQGLLDEVKGLLADGFRQGITAPQAIGYKEIVEALEGRCTLDEAVESIKQATRRYAKRQRTWFRRDSRIHWIDADDGDIQRMSREILAQLDRSALPV